MPYTQAHVPSSPALKAIQDALQATHQDLHQLDVMLNHHCEGLIAAFEGTISALNHAAATDQGCADGHIQEAKQLLSQAVLNMQFQDIASQMLSHCQSRLQACTDLMEQPQPHGLQTHEASVLPPAHGPVTQASMDAGSIDLFDWPTHSRIQGETP
ncbi:hypothetical protein E9531_12950 [Lampropedia puyangensis]|uniref:Uncharacterized protein n=1 Tax=Lampropedia puyangensis TaxID=1330072 RepID=A0A4S8F1I1_9BURK|nr:hypothetical protein [Lampropedia puyangensis]THT98991.1 hypothetical protein E9531_12950 [Lampropedia puyangensis]